MTDTQNDTIAHKWLSNFAAALQASDADAAAKLFGDECYWRDLVTFTWNIKTMEGRDEIRTMLESCIQTTNASSFAISSPVADTPLGVEAWFTFETEVARGEGVLRLSDGKCHTLFTAMTELKGFEEPKGPTRPRGAVHRADPNRVTWGEERQRERETLGYTQQPYVVIVGGGQGGMSLGARLKQLGVPTIILEKNARAGDVWRQRYRTLVLHDPIWYDHLPYIPFPDHWPVFTPKDKLADWMEMYALLMELNYWTSSTCTKATFDEQTREWTVTVDRNGETVVLKPRQLVMATGGNGPAKPIEWPGIEQFAGEVIHSSRYSDGTSYRGKKVAVVGTGSSGFDIAVDLWENSAEVTLVQRSSSTVVKIDTLVDLSLQIYSEAALAAGITTEKADLIAASLPFKVFTEIQKDITSKIADHDAEFYAGLEKAGFLLDFGEDNSGLAIKAYRTGSGYYIDVGGADLVINGDITVKSGVGIASLDSAGIIFDDGSRIDVDAVIACTGYRSMKDVVAQLISPEVAEAVGRSGGLGSGVKGDPGPWNGEMRNLWKPTAQDSFWYMGGNLAMGRFYSKYLALQLKARMEGLPTPVFGNPG